MKFKIFTFFAVATIAVSCATKATIPEVVSETDLAEGKILLESRCIQCHQIYEPKSFDKKEWKHITHSMQKKAKLNAVEINKVYNYIVSNL
jgi:nitrate/TMAO reductase-like tetraheme cytochrome c subunit